MLDQVAYNNSIGLLHKASVPAGFVAAVNDRDNYKRIWTRDGIICSIAAFLSGDSTLIQTAKSTIRTIFDHQHTSGFIPSNVTPGSQAISYGGTAGRADNPSWAVIGLCLYTLYTADKSLSTQYKRHVEKCLHLMDAWEFNGKNLIYVPQSGDWADEFIQHGYILFEQLLRVWALRLSSQIYKKNEWNDKATAITETIRTNYWKNQEPDNLYAPHLQRQICEISDKFWLMGFNPARIYPYFDLQANALTLILKINNQQQKDQLIGYLSSLFQKSQGNMLSSFLPVIQYQDKDMQELSCNYAYEFRNKPYEFHNGGLWPVWNGWMAMALALNGEMDLAGSLTNAIHATNKRNENDFNECVNAHTNLPCGVSLCTWSAAGAVIAEQGHSGNSFLSILI
jgi:hypothetical protein